MTDNKKDSFILYTEQLELFEELTNEQAGELIKGIFNYVKTGEAPNFKGISKIAFIPIRQILDRNAEKYEEKREKMSENGKKGGRPPSRNDVFEKLKKKFEEKQAKLDAEIEAANNKKESEESAPSANNLPVLKNKKEDDCISFAEVVKRTNPEFYKKLEAHKKSKEIKDKPT